MHTINNGHEKIIYRYIDWDSLKFHKLLTIWGYLPNVLLNSDHM